MTQDNTSPKTQRERDQEYLEAKAESWMKGNIKIDRHYFACWRYEIDKDFSNKRYKDVKDGSYERKL